MNSDYAVDQDAFIHWLANSDIKDVKVRGDEVSFPCPFGGCDDDHRAGEEWHCSLNTRKGLWHCWKCGAKGNMADFKELLHGDKREDLSVKHQKKGVSLDTIARRCNRELKKEYDLYCGYLTQRGLNIKSIDRFMLGVGEFNGSQRYTIPVYSREGEVAYLKLRRLPGDDSSEILAEKMGKKSPIPKYSVYPTGAKLLLVGEDQLAKSTSSDVLICEGELDRIIAIQEGVPMPVVTAGGAQTFKDEWIDSLKQMRNIYICLDEDETGEKATESLAKRIAERIPDASIFKISLPFEKNSHSDLTDYYMFRKGTTEELFSKYATYYCGAKPIDPSQFKFMSVKDVADVLDTTIKYDYLSKLITFFAMLLAYTESDQLNIMFNADSATGKTYICSEVGKLFPAQDVRTFGKTTPTAFFYSPSLRKKDEKTGEYYVDLERLILIFTEQPDTRLQENLRSVFSHDSKRVPFAITNKGKSGRNVADEGYILGFPSTFFCSANMHIDEQEQTRCLILSPESTQEKLTESINTSIIKNSDKAAYNARLDNDKARKELMERLLYIKSLHIESINIGDSEYLKKVFMKGRDVILPKTQREITHFISLAKAVALLNAMYRMEGGKIVVTNEDIDEAAKLWWPLSKSMRYGVSPQVLNFYTGIILPTYYAKCKSSMTTVKGVTYDEIRKAYYEKIGSTPNMENVRKQYIPALKSAALISCDKDESDGRRSLIVPLELFNDELEETE